MKNLFLSLIILSGGGVYLYSSNLDYLEAKKEIPNLREEKTKIEILLKNINDFGYVALKNVDTDLPLLKFKKNELSNFEISNEEMTNIISDFVAANKSLGRLINSRDWQSLRSILGQFESGAEINLSTSVTYSLTLNQIERGFKKMQSLIQGLQSPAERIKMQAKVLEKIKFRLNLLSQEHNQRLQEQEAILKAGPNLLLGSLFTFVTLAIILIPAWRDRRERLKNEAKKRDQEKRILNHFLENSQIAWALFDFHGNLLSGGGYLRKFLSIINPELSRQPINWQTVVETLNLKNIYSIASLPEGERSFGIRLNRAQSGESLYRIKLVKSLEKNNIFLILSKEDALEMITSEVIEDSELSLYGIQAIAPLVEDVLEGLSPIIQATHMKVKMDISEDLKLRVDPQNFKKTISDLIKNSLLYSNHFADSQELYLRISRKLDQVELKIVFYGKGFSKASLHYNLSQVENETTLDDSLVKVEQNLSYLKPQIEILNNLDKNKKFLHSHISVQFQI